MTEDKDDNIWICTEGGGLNLFDRKKKTFTYFMADPDRNSIAHDNLKSIAYSANRNKLTSVPTPADYPYSISQRNGSGILISKTLRMP